MNADDLQGTAHIIFQNLILNLITIACGTFLYIGYPVPTTGTPLSTIGEAYYFNTVCVFIATCKVVQESLGFPIPRCGFRIP